MIFAGNLKEIVIIYDNQDVQSESGFIKKTKVQIYKAKFERIKISFKQNEDNAKELFTESNLIIRLRLTDKVKENQTALIDTINYKIIGVEKYIKDREMKLTLEKINK